METTKSKKEVSLTSRLFNFAGNYKYFTIIGMICSAVSAVIALLPIIYIWLGVKEIFMMYPNIEVTDSLTNYAIMSLVMALLSMLLYCAGLMCTHVAAFRIARNIKSQALSHLMQLPLGYFNQNGSGNMKRIISDSATRTETYLAHQLPDMTGAFVTPIAVIVFLFVFNWKLGLLCMIPIILSLLTMCSSMMGSTAKDDMINYEASLSKMNNEAVEYVRGISVVKTFGQSVFSFKKFHDSIKEYEEFVIYYTDNFRISMVGFQTLIGVIALFLVGGSIFIFQGNINTKEFMLDFLFYIFFSPICSVMLMKIMYSSQNSMVAKEAINKVDALLHEKPLEYKDKTKTPIAYDIEFDNVSFTYPNAINKAIDNISFSVKQGQTVALVGTSGSGKSTIATLIARFFDIQEGAVKIGGVDVRDMNEADLMATISFVFQNTTLYKMSVYENVCEGKPGASKEEVMEALKMARCQDIIDKLPDGIDTIVGTKGIYLSGGEAQRIAIARAILKNAPIILLDEATAFTDPENEHEIQLAMSELAKNKTVIIIAHRLSTIQEANTIYVIEDGKIAENGTHEELTNKDSKYKEMWEEYNHAFIWKESEVQA
ncbi:ABC transporter ATP-binding protein [Tannockella kyphosi]|uniref:ABC transporter ATP-binding protein n=1 Tax=Tannockella kyphosi TaxID=2899121 RepID=UPI002013BACB|nr:ABC transporter ATP-binding protein [Tannockella kyphosi]